VSQSFIFALSRELTDRFRPVRTYNTAAVYFHKFCLLHPDGEYDLRVRFEELVMRCSD